MLDAGQRRRTPPALKERRNLPAGTSGEDARMSEHRLSMKHEPGLAAARRAAARLASERPAPRRTAALPASARRRPAAPDVLQADAARAEMLDRLMHAAQARFTQSISPAALMLAYADWAVHLANAPGKQAALVEKAWRKLLRFAIYASRSLDLGEPPCIEPLPQDRRFDAEEWRRPPFNL